MKKLIPAALLALCATFARPAAAEMPCEGSNDSCSWTCNQDGQGNILNYSVSCNYADWCVGADGSVGLGLCDSQAPSDDPVVDAVAELSLLDEEMANLDATCPAPTKGGALTPAK